MRELTAHFNANRSGSGKEAGEDLRAMAWHSCSSALSTSVSDCTSTSISTRVPARTLANPIARRPNMSESYSETRVLEYPFSTPFDIQKGTYGY